MLTIDGGRLEGGGQIARMAVSLSALTGTPVEITNIRARRDKPGLKPQHVAAIEAVASLCDARLSGISPGSTVLTFIPSKPRKNDIYIDVGTAGGITLVLQPWLPVALKTGGSITVRGGTEVEHSPTIDYLQRVFLPPLLKSGARISISILQRGYYPKGGGLVKVIVEPSVLTPLHLTETVSDSGIISCSSNLPDHVAERQAASARERLFEELRIDPPVILDRRTGLSTGSSCTVWQGAKGGVSLGIRGLPAEKVGAKAADALIGEIRAGGVVDSHLSDQLLVYLALYGGAFTTGSMTLHTKTMHWLLSEFGYRVSIDEKDVVEMGA